MNPLVTVVLPTYNSAKYIRDSLGTILAQTYPNIEIIVMDGASKDGTADIAREIAPGALVISEPDRGQTHAINKGWAMAKGDIITWLCADDGYYPDTVANAVAALTAHPDAMWVYGLGDYLNEQGDSSPLKHPVQAWDYTTLRDRVNFIIQPATFLRKDILTHKGFPDEALHYIMDYEYWLRIGQDIPGLFVPDIRVWVKMYRETKTASGKVNRLLEVQKTIRHYGGSDLPSLMHWEWTAAYLSEFFKHLRQGKFRQLGTDIREIFRYPTTIPRAVIKSAVTWLPPHMETRLRQWFVHPPEAAPSSAKQHMQ